MHSPLERGASIAGLLVLIASLHLILSLAGVAASLSAAVALGAIGAWLWLRFDLPHRHIWLVCLLLAAAILVSTILRQIAMESNGFDWLAPLFTFGASMLTVELRIRNRERCNLCNRRLKLQAVTFRCPRCFMLVCDGRCWDFDHRRCTMCLENRVPVLPMQDSWWNRIAGPRATNGRCQICLASAEQADLRACGKCRRLQCRDCWDYANGECSRCATALPELPVSLRNMVAETEQTRQPFTSHEASKWKLSRNAKP